MSSTHGWNNNKREENQGTQDREVVLKSVQGNRNLQISDFVMYVSEMRNSD